jgi:hypothetical protein
MAAARWRCSCPLTLSWLFARLWWVVPRSTATVAGSGVSQAGKGESTEGGGPCAAGFVFEHGWVLLGSGAQSTSAWQQHVARGGCGVGRVAARWCGCSSNHVLGWAWPLGMDARW